MVILFFCFQALLAQSFEKALVDQASSYPSFFVSGIKKSLTNRSNQVILGGAGITVLLLHQFDKEVKTYSQDYGLMPDQLSHLLDLYGGGLAYPITMVGVGMESSFNGEGWEERIRKLKYVMTSVGVTATLTEIIKISVGRERPNGKNKKAFPSGHTSGSFVIASVLDELYGRNIGLPAFFMAGLVGAQRIHDNKHWLTDVIAGAALGTVIGHGFGKIYRNEVKNSLLSIVPARAGGDFYIRIVFSLN